MALTESDEGKPWWGNNTKLVSVIIGFPLLGLITIGVLTLIGINTPDFPYMISADFFCSGPLPKIAHSPDWVYRDSSLLEKYGR